MQGNNLKNLRICIKGAGDIATGIAVRLYMSGFTRILMLETERPLAVRRTVSFSEAIYLAETTVEGIVAKQVERLDQIEATWQGACIPVMIDPDWQTLRQRPFDVVVDAILAKKNLGSHCNEAPLVIGMGPGFTAGTDVHRVVETHRGHNLGRVIRSGQAAANTGIPGGVSGYTIERVLKSPHAGIFTTDMDIGDLVKTGRVVGQVAGVSVVAGIDGVLRGLLRSGTEISQGTKIGDIDPREDPAYCFSVSDKARCLGGSVLEAILEASFLYDTQQFPKRILCNQH
ncbi:selenium-dependent molybdenum cofactor biosynthesis protein YqeB [Desulforhopalus sp. IMCC35007]|uniref:selenium-dependent molybdenum cofactor biosynthesis protein YqeB n=1 Tax=Desulforhopalus sp. IMCC35007 TaxID=2569543 RepID=UPI0010AEB030|nr:selenium-dependent molybdenum cofactor biosynthesis protein YqeB [Desulforhopalus sp. IMCC35007]TKB06774.1 EF2563 family selenium-dependent molybdenum hydroxylase system protein [Desulforhopalus sp. IMCC35007]